METRRTLVGEKLVVLDPVVEPTPNQVAMAPRPGSLLGKKIGFIDNTKPNVRQFLDMLEQELKDNYGVTEIVRRRKANASVIAAPEILDELAANTDLVVAAVGD
jgi:hypothetical protein